MKIEWKNDENKNIKNSDNVRLSHYLDKLDHSRALKAQLF